MDQDNLVDLVDRVEVVQETFKIQMVVASLLPLKVFLVVLAKTLVVLLMLPVAVAALHRLVFLVFLEKEVLLMEMVVKEKEQQLLDQHIL
tara:strand:+ start:310 stop:579 length:270 start_codon:yes stop_codon:yes gene_type:complete